MIRVQRFVAKYIIPYFPKFVRCVSKSGLKELLLPLFYLDTSLFDEASEKDHLLRRVSEFLSIKEQFVVRHRQFRFLSQSG